MPMDLDELAKYISIQISDDKLTAYLQFNQDNKQLKFTLEQLEELLKSNGVTYGIHYDKCSEIAREPQRFLYDKSIVATGDEPVQGKDGYINHLFSIDDDSNAPLHLLDGTVDHKQVKDLNNVKKGQLIAEKIEPEEGISGRAVTGEELPAKTGKTVNLRVGKNVVADEDRLKLFAAIDGLVSMTSGSVINIFPVYEVNGDVDYSIGNIDFVGTVVIRGNVLTGFQVRAKGDIRVVGGVEGAELYADGSIEITAGVMGTNKGLIKAGKNVKTSFLQEANIEAGEDVNVTQSIMHSKVRAGNQIICEGKGLIVGGTIQAGKLVTARTIGNTMSTATVIEVGVQPALRNELIELRKKIGVSTENMGKTEKALVILDQLASAGQLDKNKAELRSRLTITRRETKEQLANFKERMLEIEKSLEETGHAKVEVKGNVYGGTKIVIGRSTRYVKDTVQRAVFKLAEGEIDMSSLV